MKICIPKYGLGVLSAFLSRDVRGYPVWLIALIVVCVVALVCGSHTRKNHFGLWGIGVLGTAGMLIGGGTFVLGNRKTVRKNHGLRPWKSVPQITSTWDYRPRDATLRDATVNSNVKTETHQEPGSSPAVLDQKDNAWFNVANPEPTLEESTIKAPVPDNVYKASP